MGQSARALFVVSTDAQIQTWVGSQAKSVGNWQVTWRPRWAAEAVPPGAVALMDVRTCTVGEIAQLGAAVTADRLAIALVQGSGVAQAVAAMRAGFYLACEPNGLAAALAQAFSDSESGAAVPVGNESVPRQYQRRLAQLVSRERDVLDLVLAGLPNKNIAKRLGYSLKTIEVRRQSVMRKLQVESVAELVRVTMTAEPNWRLPERLDRAAAESPRRIDPPAACPLPAFDAAMSPQGVIIV